MKGEVETVNVPRLTTRTRKEVARIEDMLVAAIEDRIVDPHEESDLKEAIQGVKALATVVDINDARGRATSIPQVRALNAEFDAWVELLPETA